MSDAKAKTPEPHVHGPDCGHAHVPVNLIDVPNPNWDATIPASAAVAASTRSVMVWLDKLLLNKALIPYSV
jgi:hypothetical protein